MKEPQHTKPYNMNQQHIKAIIAILVICALNAGQSCNADENAPIAYTELVCKEAKGPSPTEEGQALRTVKVAMVEKYIASLGSERQALVSARRTEIVAAVDSYVENITIRSKQFDKKSKVLTLAAQGTVSKAKVDALIDSGSGEKSPIVFIFVARRQSEVKNIGSVLETGTKDSISTTKSAAEESGKNEAVQSTGEETTAAKSSASSVTHKADKITYVLEDNAKSGIDGTISKVLVDRGFDVVPASELVGAPNGGFDADKFQKDFETSSEFTKEHQSLATRVCREAGAPMLAYGTLTIGMKKMDPVNNRNTIVNVIVDARVLDCRKQFAIKVGSIAALQVNGVGADQTEAETAALDIAAQKAATVLADQLRSRGIR